MELEKDRIKLSAEIVGVVEVFTVEEVVPCTGTSYWRFLINRNLGLVRFRKLLFSLPNLKEPTEKKMVIMPCAFFDGHLQRHTMAS